MKKKVSKKTTGKGKGKSKAAKPESKSAATPSVVVDQETQARAIAMLDKYFGATVIRHDPQRPVVIVNPVPGQSVMVVTDDPSTVSVVDPAALNGV